jgi:hypothetical protein
MIKYVAIVRWGGTAPHEPDAHVTSSLRGADSALRLADMWARDNLHPDVYAEAEIEFLGRDRA